VFNGDDLSDRSESRLRKKEPIMWRGSLYLASFVACLAAVAANAEEHSKDSLQTVKESTAAVCRCQAGRNLAAAPGSTSICTASGSDRRENFLAST
jgi:hypothetical protein